MAKVNANTSFFYVRNRDKFPVGCVAFKTLTDINNNLVVKYGYSVYNPKDEFNKWNARAQAESRLNDNPREILFHVKPSKVHINDALADVCWDMACSVNPYTEAPNNRRFMAALDNTGYYLAKCTRRLSWLGRMVRWLTKWV